MILTLAAVLFLFQGPSPEVIQHAQAGAKAEQDGQLDLAADEFKKVIDLAPGLASGYANLGSVYFRKGEYMGAIPVLQRALTIDPELNATHQILGVALLVEGDAAGALPHLEKAPVPEILGLAYLETGQAGNALTSFQAALNKQPEDPDVLYYFGHAAALASHDVFSRLTRIDAAAHLPAEAAPAPGPIPDLTPLARALLEKPDDPKRLHDFAAAAAAASRQAFVKLQQTSGATARAHQIRAEMLAEKERIGDAKAEYIEALTLQPYTAGVHQDFGKLLVLAGDLPHALTEFRTECIIRPLSAEAFYYAGTTMLALRQAKDALPVLAHAEELGPGKPPISLALGKAASATGDFSQAEHAFTRVIEADPNSDLAARAREALESIGQQKKNTK